MKLNEHVAILKSAIENAYDKEFARLGFGKTKVMDIEQIPPENQMRRQRFESMLDSHIGETGDYAHAREKLVDELTFTLFNRLAAVKVMEAANLFPPIITRRAEHGGRSFGHKAWLETNPHQRDGELEGLRAYIKTAFDEMGVSLPLFSTEYTFSLFPDTISLNEIIDLFNAVDLDNQIDLQIWESDDVLGWCYESYNSNKKKELKDSGKKIEYNYVSLQSQVYTPRWVVQFLVDNSLGKLYLEMFPDSHIKNKLKIANVPKSRVRDIKPLHQVRIIDPACGSGNFLLYAFDLFYELYLDQIENYGAAYNETDIPQLIIENNLHGIDLDDRAVQLAQLGLFIKACKISRSMNEFDYHTVSSDFYLPDYAEVAHVFEANTNLGQKQRDLVAEIWEDLRYAYKFGSLIRLKEKVGRRLQVLFGQQGTKEPSLFSNNDLGEQPESIQTDAFFEQDIASEREFIENFFLNLRTAVDQYARTEKNSFIVSKTQDAIMFLELMSGEYDVAAANPPYTDSSDFGPELKTFIEANYKRPYKFHTNLYATFIKRCYDLIGAEGYIATIQPLTFMYIKTFEDVRKFILNNTQIDLFVELGLGGVFLSHYVVVYAAAYILKRSRSPQGKSLFINFQAYHGKLNKRDLFESAFQNYLNNIPDKHNYLIDQSKLKMIKSWPFIYWISDAFREKFTVGLLKEFADANKGIDTANNLRYLRFWWEVKNELNWNNYSKGGAFKKWYGNLWLKIFWKDDGHAIKNDPRSNLRNKDSFFKEGVTYSGSGSKGTSFRYLPGGFICDNGGSSITPTDKLQSIPYLLAFINSKLVKYIVSCLNPTVNVQKGDLERIPFVRPASSLEKTINSYSTRNIEIEKYLLSYSVVESHFVCSPLSIMKGNGLESTIKIFFDFENRLITQVLINEGIINKKIFEVYNLTENDKAMVLAQEGESIGGLPVLPEARDAYFAETATTKEYPIDDIREFIESLPLTEISAEERKIIESDFPTLYQSNNDLEGFCTRHQLNPINIWYWFKQSSVIPKQRMQTLALEFLVDMVREILMEDEDGIIPLVPNAGEKVLLDRIEEKFNMKGFNSAHYANYDSLLGRSIPDYLNKYFFAELSERLNLFRHLPMTPFIWHLTSGPDRGFDCYIIIYKWSRDNLMRLRSVYIEHRERALINRQSDLAENQSASAQTEKDLIFRQLHEIESFKSKIDELLAEGYNPILDDGVGKNIAPLQKKGMIPYEVLNPGQLKKYLNADW